MRAVYVPTPVVPGGAAYLVATTPTGEGDGTLTLYSAARSTQGTARLKAEHLRQVLRQWADADRAGQGRLELDN